MNTKKTLLYFALACSLGVQAQTRQEMGGVYHAYPLGPAPETGTLAADTVCWTDSISNPPAGFTPFYISHYGRHGSRWMPKDERYTWVNRHFEDDSNLTPLGKKIKKILAKVWENARGNGGKLSKLGELQHRGIADRMFRRFPQIFVSGHHVEARSSVVDRCAKSMQAFTDELRQLQPGLSLDVKTDSADMAWIAYTSPEVKALENRTHVTAKVSPDRFLRQLFKDISKVEDPMKLMGEMHTIASSIQDVGLNFKSYPVKVENTLNALFTNEEFTAFYDANNLRMTICNGDLPTGEGIPARSAISLWTNIESEAAKALASDRPSVTLRFGHDTSLYRLLSLLHPISVLGKTQAELDANSPWVSVGYADLMDRLLPMAANLQMVFYKSLAPQGDIADEVLVKMVLNEKKEAMPLELQAWKDGEYGNVYRWTDIKNYMSQRIHELEHIRQLNAINTMVGTAQANTQTAGMFGKGSEEHGQTLPAVLVPNGQNFWTPQTQDTEQKCIAPYYYKGTELQGFRNSHWIVGGCTQDYGSFTVATLGDKLRLLPSERSTPFSHADEVSHPHYYAVQLKQEHLRAELTALSHTSILRVTPDKDELVHIVINPNSDEKQGYIQVDTVHHLVYGYNPVHRIYQGWGEKTGFSGHFVLKYYNELVDKGVKDGCAWLTFQGKADTPMVFAAASSFTSKENALNNLNKELPIVGDGEEPDFIVMMREATNAWIARLHTIDVESKDTVKVNQFYGALYRASFLPHEMSDVNGDYPTFSTGEIKHQDSSLLSFHSSFPKSYGDYSMWDIYRAELPLYNIITPTMSGDMMQSLVNMYKEGGWMPIFPCWNSYTAAMIGDHAGAALADAYVKGIRNFDVQTAYEGMRKNAFESPKTFEEYKNGMGRRALKSYLKYGYIPMEDSVKEAFHTNEQTSRTLEYAFDDFAVAQMAQALGKQTDYTLLMKRSENWRNVINPKTGWADGRHQNGKWDGNQDWVHRKSYITEGATCHYTWYVPQNIAGLFDVIGKSADKSGKIQERNQKVVARLDKMFDEGLYWHGNEPCHQVAYLYDAAGVPEKTQEWVHHILNTEYNDTPGGLSGNDDAGQMSAWYVFSSIGFYPVCPATPYYYIGTPSFDKVTFNLENGKKFTVLADGLKPDAFYIKSATLNDKPFVGYQISHDDITKGGILHFSMRAK